MFLLQWLPLAECVKPWQSSTQLRNETPIPPICFGPCSKAALRNYSGPASLNRSAAAA